MQKAIEWMKQNYLIVLTIVVVLLPLLYFLLSGGPQKVTIRTVDGGEIYVASAQELDFELIGTGVAEYTRVDERRAFVQVIDGDSVSIGALRESDWDAGEYELGVTEVSDVTTEKFLEGALQDLFIEGDEAFGIAPSSGSIVNFSLTGFVPPRDEFIKIPASEEIFWESSDSYAYNSYKRGVHFFNNGREVIQLEEDFLDIEAIAQQVGGGLISFATADSLYTLDSLADQPQFISGVTPIDGVSVRPVIFVNDERIYYVPQPFPSAFDDAELVDSGDLEHNDDEALSEVRIFDHQGNESPGFTLHGANVFAIEEAGPNRISITDDEIYVNEIDRPYYFRSEQSTAVYNDTVFVLNKAGIWTVDPDSQSLRLFTRLPEGEEGLRNTFEVVDGNVLRFGTIKAGASSSTGGGIYTIQL